MSVKEKKIPHFFISIYPPLLCVCVSLFNKLSKLWITKEAWQDKMPKKKGKENEIKEERRRRAFGASCKMERVLSWRQSSYFDAIHWRTSVPLCTVDVAMFLRQRDEKTNKRKSEMNWSRIEKFLFFLLLLSDESLVEAGTLFEGEKPLIAIMVSSYRVVFFVFLIYFCFAFLFFFAFCFETGENAILFGEEKREAHFDALLFLFSTWHLTDAFVFV